MARVPSLTIIQHLLTAQLMLSCLVCLSFHSQILNLLLHDEVTIHLIGKPVRIRDAFRIGHKKPNSGESSRPRPLLIKLDNCWDRRILLNSYAV